MPHDSRARPLPKSLAHNGKNRFFVIGQMREIRDRKAWDIFAP